MKKGIGKLVKKCKKPAAPAQGSVNEEEIGCSSSSLGPDMEIDNERPEISIHTVPEGDIDNGRIPLKTFNCRSGTALPQTQARENLRAAVEKLRISCAKFAEYNKDFLAGNEFQSLVNRAQQETNVHRSAEIFRSEISEVIRIKSQGDEVSKKKVLPRVGHFLVKIFPVAKLSLGLTGSIAEVSSHFFALLIVGRGICTRQVRGQWTWYYSAGINSNGIADCSCWNKSLLDQPTFKSNSSW